MSYFVKWFVLMALYFLMSFAYASDKVCFVFQGVNGELLKNIQAIFKLDSHACVNNLSYNEKQQFYQQIPKLIKQAIEPFGYFKSHVSVHVQSLHPVWLIHVHIFLGDVLTIHSLQLQIRGEGKDNAKIKAFLRQFPLKLYTAFQVATYNKAKREWFIIARNEGYIKAYYQNRIVIDLQKYTCHIEMTLITGRRYYFGPISFTNNIYAPNFVRKFVLFNSNEPFSSQKLIQLQQAMEQSYFFRQVIVTPDFNNIQDNHIPIQIDYAVPKAKKYTLGIGYGTLTGPRLSAGMSLRRITDTGQHFEADMKLSSVVSGMSANYYIPGRHPLTDEWLLGANIKKFLPNAGKSDSTTLSAGYSTKTEHARYGLNMNYLLERFKIYPFPGRKAHEFYPAVNYSYINVDNLTNPRKGYSLTFSLRGATDNILSTTSFIQPEVSSKLFFSPFTFAEIILRGDIGYTAVHHLVAFPLSLRFFAGGMNSVRGFADSSIGPGRYLTTGSIEYQQKVYKDFNAAIFYDIGTATDHFNTAWNRGAGVGIVYNSVLGPARLYLARAISKSSQPYSIEFSIGPEFS